MKTSLLLASLLILTACQHSKAVEQHSSNEAPSNKPSTSEEHRDEPEHETFPKRVKLSQKVIDDAKIKFAPVGKEVLVITLTLPGEVSVDPDRNARVSSPVAGRIAEVRFREGSKVKKGERLATLRIPDLAKLRAEYAATASKATSARTNATRLQELAEKGLASNQETLNAKTEADSFEAEAHALDQQLRTLGMGATGSGSDLALHAPISGTVISRAAVVGQPVTTEETIANIADLSEVWFLGRVFEKDLDEVHTNAKAEIELNAFPKRRFAGSVEYVGQQIDPVARTVTARIRLSNPEGLLRIGLFGTAHIATGTDQGEPVLVVPRSAVTEIGGKPVVFVQQTDGDFELHEVVLGQSNLGRIQVLSGLREGERVVTEGTFTVKSAVLRSSLAEEE